MCLKAFCFYSTAVFQLRLERCKKTIGRSFMPLFVTGSTATVFERGGNELAKAGLGRTLSAFVDREIQRREAAEPA